MQQVDKTGFSEQEDVLDPYLKQLKESVLSKVYISKAAEMGGALKAERKNSWEGPGQYFQRIKAVAESQVPPLKRKSDNEVHERFYESYNASYKSEYGKAVRELVAEEIADRIVSQLLISSNKKTQLDDGERAQLQLAIEQFVNAKGVLERIMIAFHESQENITIGDLLGHDGLPNLLRFLTSIQTTNLQITDKDFNAYGAGATGKLYNSRGLLGERQFLLLGLKRKKANSIRSMQSKLVGSLQEETTKGEGIQRIADLNSATLQKTSLEASGSPILQARYRQDFLSSAQTVAQNHQLIEQIQEFQAFDPDQYWREVKNRPEIQFQVQFLHDLGEAWQGWPVSTYSSKELPTPSYDWRRTISDENFAVGFRYFETFMTELAEENRVVGMRSKLRVLKSKLAEYHATMRSVLENPSVKEALKQSYDLSDEQRQKLSKLEGHLQKVQGLLDLVQEREESLHQVIQDALQQLKLAGAKSRLTLEDFGDIINLIDGDGEMPEGFLAGEEKGKRLAQ